MRELLPQAEKVAALLIARKETVAVAESSAGGLIAAALLAVPGASAYFLGGAVLYTRKAWHALREFTDEEFGGARPATEANALVARAHHTRAVRGRLGHRRNGRRRADGRTLRQSGGNGLPRDCRPHRTHVHDSDRQQRSRCQYARVRGWRAGVAGAGPRTKVTAHAPRFLSRLRTARAPAACCAAYSPANVAHAQAGAWKPEKNIEIVVGLTAGSSQDRGARAIQSIAQAKSLLGVTSSVVNRVGGGGNVAWSYLAQHAGDAHWLQIASPTILTNYIIGTSQSTYTHYTPLALLGNQYIGLAVRADSRLKTARDVVERLRADPSSISFGINSLGSYLHLVGALTARAAGIDPKKLKLVVFQGG